MAKVSKSVLSAAIVAISDNVATLKNEASAEQRKEMVAYAEGVIMATVGDDKKGNQLGIPSLGKLGQLAFQNAITNRYGKVKAGKKGDTIAKVSLEDVTFDMIFGIDATTFITEVGDVATDKRTALAKQGVEMSTMAELDGDGKFKGALYTADEIAKFLADGENVIATAEKQAESWAETVLPLLPRSVIVLNDLQAGFIKIGKLPQLPLSLVVPIMVAGYTISASVLSKIHNRVSAKSSVIARIKSQRTKDTIKSTDAVVALLGVVADEYSTAEATAKAEVVAAAKAKADKAAAKAAAKKGELVTA